MPRRTLPTDPCLPDEYGLPEGEALDVKTSDGAVLATTIAGTGPTVVLPHCWTGSRAVWSPVAHRLLRAGRRVVLYDQRGHGESTVGADGYGLAALADDLRAVMEAADVRDAVLAGHSMGGMTVQALTVKHPDVVDERVSRLVLVATAAHGVGMAQIANAAIRVVGGAGLERVLRGRRGARFLRGTVGAVAHPKHVELTRDLFVATPGEARAGFLAAMQRMDLRPHLGEIDVPVTMIVASRDTVTPPRLGRELASLIPDCRLVELEGMGHMLPLEAPDVVAAEILG